MAATYTIRAGSVALPTSAAAKTMIQIYNQDATQKLNIVRVWVMNIQIAAVTGAFQTLTLGRNTTIQTTGATAITPIRHDTSSAALVNTVANHSPTTSVTLIDTFRTTLYSGEEFATGTTKFENMRGMPNFALLWDGGHGDSRVQPIILNQNQGLSLIASGVASGVGAIDTIVELFVT